MHFALAFDVQVLNIRLLNAKIWWGICYFDGCVYLNWRLIQMLSDLIDYVVVYELVYLCESNHS